MGICKTKNSPIPYERDLVATHWFHYILTHCRRATRKLVIDLSCVVEGSRVSSLSCTTPYTWQKRVCRTLCKKTKTQFLKSRAQEHHNLQCQIVSKNMLRGWTFKVFKTSGNWGYLIKRPSSRRGVNTGCFTTLGHNCRRWFPRSLWWKKFI